MKQFIYLLIFMSLISSELLCQEHTVLLHGLARSSRSMQQMEAALTEAGYTVHNLDYDSRHHSVEELADRIAKQIEPLTASANKVHIVTHSLGGILIRQLQASTPIQKIGRVVMLSPPNRGSEVVDKIGHWSLFQKINGPAGQQLGTGEDSFINQLPRINFECGVITGDRSINWINSQMIPGKDDGKVSIASAHIEGLADYKVIHATHPMIMKKKSVITDVIKFLESGSFE